MSLRNIEPIAIIALLALSPLAAAGEIAILASGDTEGRLLPCGSCPESAGRGGMARRATVVAEERKSSPGLLVLDAGNALFGAESLSGSENAIALAYDLLGVDAVNISWRDFRLGAAATREALHGAKFEAVSANVIDATSGRPFAKPYAVRKSGDIRVAILGATEPPLGLAGLPHLQAQLEGLRILDPVEALRPAVAAAHGEADALVLLWYGSGQGLRRVREAYVAEFACIAAAGLRPDEVPAGMAPVLVGRPDGSTLAAVRVDPAQPASATVREIGVGEAVAPDPAMADLVASLNGRPSGEAPPADLPPSPPALPRSPETARSYPLLRSAENRAVRLSLSAASFREHHGSLAASEDGLLLVLESVWENIIPFTLVEKKLVPTEYRVPVLRDHLYLVLDGSRLIRLAPAEDLPGHVKLRNLSLPRIGSREEGTLVFPIPERSITSLELRFYDFAHGHLTIPLVPAAAPTPTPSGPLASGQNEVLDVAVQAIETVEKIGGRKAPQEMVFLVVDLRARSRFTIDADKTAFDPKAPQGARLKVGTVADWKEARTHLQLVADGEYGYAPDEATNLDAEPRFLPDLMTGGRVVFLAPKKTVSLELRCDFPNASGPDGKVFHPTGFALPIAGVPPTLADRKPIVSVVDDVYQVAVVGQKATLEFAGEKVDDGQAFLVLDVTVKNTGKKGEFFQTREQLRHAAEDGQEAAFDPVTFQGVHPPAPLVWIPAGQRRTLQVVYRVAAGETRPRLVFTGVSLARVLDLQPLKSPPRARGGESPPARTDAEPATKPSAKATEPMARPPAGGPPPAPGGTDKTPRPGSPVAAATKLPRRVAARQPGAQRGLAGVGLTLESVNRAIDRGSEFLWNQLRADLAKTRRQLGSKDGYDVLPSLALVHSGGHGRFPEFDAALKAFLAKVDPVKDLGATYDVGLLCMLVEAYGDSDFLPKLRRGARYLLETQGPEGSWGYGRGTVPECLGDGGDDRVLSVQGGTPLDDSGLAEEPWKRLCKWDPNADGDNSVSQYAILGLHSASRTGLRIEPEAWRRVLAAHEKRQNADGGWCYHVAGSASYGSMTSAGICSRAIARHALGETDPAEDEGIEKGLGWLSANFTVGKNPPSHPWLYYYLYSLERVGRILDTEFIGEYEWYPLGARHLLSEQKPDGSWIGLASEADPNLATSFALLFLTRATASLADEPKRGGTGVLKTGITLAPANSYYLIVDASGSMLAEMDGRTKFDIAREAVTGLVEKLPDASRVALRVYGHRKLAIEKGASEDTALEIPMGPLVRKNCLAKLAALRARGKTPLARSLLEAKRDLAGTKAESPVTVVLLTDGGEDTLPRQDPLKAAEEFGKLEGISLHVVGFDIQREDWQVQLEEMTRLAGGRYWPVGQASALTRELRAAVFGVPADFSVLDGTGREAASGEFGQARTLEEGKYTFRTEYAGAEFQQEFWVNTGTTTSVIFHASKVARAKAGAVRPRPAGAVPTPAASTGRGETPPANPPQPLKKFCSGCGKPVKLEQKFCPTCGAKTGN